MSAQSRMKYKDIQLPQLRSFCLVASEGNFTAAAAAQSLSVSAVWQQVRALETKLGVTLLCRRGRTVELTLSGRLLLELSQPHVHGLDSLARLFQARQAELPNPLAVVATPHLLVHHLPDLVEQFIEHYPTARINLRAARWHEILELVERGEADVGLTPVDHHAPRRPNLDFEPLFEQSLLLLTSSDHPLRRKKLLRPRDLAEYPVIIQTKDTCDYLSLVRLLGRDELTLDQLQVVMVSHTVDMTFQYVARRVGIALAHVDPRTCRSVPGVHGRVFDSQMDQLPFMLVVRKNAHRSPLVDAFRTATRQALRRS